MGNSQPKFEYSLLTESEKPIVIESFKMMSKNSKYIRKNKLRKFWDMQVDPLLLQYIVNFLYPENDKVGFQRFAGMFVYGTRGTLDERISMFKFSMTSKKDKKSKNEVVEVSRSFIKEYVKAVVTSFMRILRLEQGHHYKTWTAKGFRIIEDNVAMLAESLTHEHFPGEIITRSDVEKWLSQYQIFPQILECIFFHLYNYRGTIQKESSVYSLNLSTLPICENENFTNKYLAFIDISQILFINSKLPNSLRYKWRILYSSRANDESFGYMLNQIINQGPTIIIVEDTNGFIFGGFSTDSWTLSSNFTGSDQSFLFSLRPRMRSFPATNYNDHYQYLNLNQQTMPNGLGIGGQFNYWGLWIDSEYGDGECSDTCTTYKNYVQLAATKKFKIRNIEVWGVGDKPILTEEKQDSILSTSSMEKAFLIENEKELYNENL